MRITSPYFSTVLEIHSGEVFSLIIEEQTVLRKFLEDIHLMLSGEEGLTVFSEDNVPLRVDKYVDIMENFAPFDINTKSVLSGINARIEKVAMEEENYLKSSEMISEIQKYLLDLCYDLPFALEWRKLTVQSLIKAASVSVANDYENPLEAVLDYMEIMSEVNHKKLFITVNMRDFFTDRDITLFTETVCKKQYRLLMVESQARPQIHSYNQLIIDCDLCEI